MNEVKVVDTIPSDNSIKFVMNYIQNIKPCDNVILVPSRERAIELQDFYKDCNLFLFDKMDNFCGIETIMSAENIANTQQKLIENHANIITDKTFFEYINSETRDLLIKNKYTLFVENCENMFNEIKMHPRDFEILSHLCEDPTQQRIFKVCDDEYLETRGVLSKDIEKLRFMQAYRVDENYTVSFMGKDAFSLFDSVILFTTFFEYSILRYGMKLEGIKYSYYHIENEKLVEGKEDDAAFRKLAKNLINLYEGKLNDVGKVRGFLHADWMKSKKYKEDRNILGKNMYNYYRNISGSPSDEFMWTMEWGKKGNEIKKIVGNRLSTRNYLDYMNNYTALKFYKSTLEFCVDVLMPKMLFNLFRGHVIDVNTNMYSLSILIQWIWRSRIRDGQPINLYLPSQRMRNLLIRWENGEEL